MNNYFINKYKPKKLNDFVLDDEIKNLFSNLVLMNNLNLIIHGDSGSGKTTIINALINEYYENNNHLDNVLYLNNLKDQGIQYFRNEMKIFCQSTCSIRNKKKIIVIDDLDTINEQSQQVFRNYLDKYSKNINFISVCTTVQKVIESLQSRLHIIKIPHFSNNYCKNLMNKIIKNENLKIDKKSRDFVLSISNNSIRIIINHLEKIYIFKDNVNLEDCKQLCNTISFQHFDDYYNFIKKKEIIPAINVLNNLYDYGYSVIDILDYLFHYTKITELLDENLKYKIVIVLCNYISIFHNIHEDSIELSLITYDIYNLF